jgi:hypothetical protein
MLGQEDNYNPTLEALLVRRLEKIFEAMDVAEGFLFDEIIEEIEMLLQLKPPMYNELITYKNDLLEKANDALNKAVKMSEYASNEIQRDNFLRGEMASTEWDVRKEYLEKIVEVMGKNQMIPFEKPVLATVGQGEMEQYVEEKIKPTEEQEFKEEEQPLPQKPRISSSLKIKKQSDQEQFSV